MIKRVIHFTLCHIQWPTKYWNSRGIFAPQKSRKYNNHDIIVSTPIKFGMHMSKICMYSKHNLSSNNIKKIITVTIVTCFPYEKMANDSSDNLSFYQLFQTSGV